MAGVGVVKIGPFGLACTINDRIETIEHIIEPTLFLCKLIDTGALY